MLYTLSLLTLLHRFILPCTANESNARFIFTESYSPNRTMKVARVRNFINHILGSDFIVDQSLFIKEFMEDTGKLYVINCPPCWGKSLNLNMLEYFLQIELEQNHSIPLKPVSKTRSYSLFVNGFLRDDRDRKKLHSPFLISEHKEFVENHMANHPVILINLPFFSRNIDQLMDDIKHAIHETFSMYLWAVRPFYEMGHEATDAKSKARAYKYIEKFKDLWFFDRKCDKQDLIVSMIFLSKVMYKSFGRKVIILLDELIPWDKWYRFKDLPYYGRKRVYEFLKDFIVATFVTNPYLEKGIISSAVPLPDELLRNDSLKNVTICNTLNGKFMKYYGFNNWQMNNIYRVMNITQQTQREIDDWYGGYKVDNSRMRIYNSWSIAQYLCNGTFQYYWPVLSDVDSFVNVFMFERPFRRGFRALLNGSDITVKRLFRYEYKWFEFDMLFRSMHDMVPLSGAWCNKSFSFLHSLGYLTLSEEYIVRPYTKEYSFRLPNREVRQLMNDVAGGCVDDSSYYENMETDIAERTSKTSLKRKYKVMKASTRWWKPRNTLPIK